MMILESLKQRKKGIKTNVKMRFNTKFNTPKANGSKASKGVALLYSIIEEKTQKR